MNEMSSSFTWRASHGEKDFSSEVRDADDCLIATELSETQANYIAAAPELLTAAYRAIELINKPRNEGVFEARKVLAAAIAKAEGKA